MVAIFESIISSKKASTSKGMYIPLSPIGSSGLYHTNSLVILLPFGSLSLYYANSLVTTLPNGTLGWLSPSTYTKMRWGSSVNCTTKSSTIDMLLGTMNRCHASVFANGETFSLDIDQKYKHTADLTLSTTKSRACTRVYSRDKSKKSENDARSPRRPSKSLSIIGIRASDIYSRTRNLHYSITCGGVKSISLIVFPVALINCYDNSFKSDTIGNTEQNNLKVRTTVEGISNHRQIKLSKGKGPRVRNRMFESLCVLALANHRKFNKSFNIIYESCALYAIMCARNYLQEGAISQAKDTSFTQNFGRLWLVLGGKFRVIQGTSHRA